MATAAIAPLPAPGESEFTRAIETHGLIFRKMAARLVGWEDSEDAVQEALVRAWKFRHQFRGDCLLSTWIAQIVRQVSFDRIRRAKPTEDCLPLESWAQIPDGTQERTWEEIYRAEQCRIVARLARSLPRAPRCFVERLLAGDNPGARTGAAKSARFHAVARLRELVLRRERRYLCLTV